MRHTNQLEHWGLCIVLLLACAWAAPATARSPGEQAPPSEPPPAVSDPPPPSHPPASDRSEDADPSPQQPPTTTPETPPPPAPPAPPELPSTDAEDRPPESTPLPPGEDLVSDRVPFFVNVRVNREDGRYRGGDTLTVTFRLEKDAHAYLLYHQADGSTVMLFPNKAHPDNRVAAKQEVTIPSDRQKYRFRVASPFGEEALQVIAATHSITELAALDLTKGQAVAVPADTLKSLSERIQKDGQSLAEHRVRLLTREGAAALPPPRKPKRVALCFGPSKYKNPDQITGHKRYKNAPELMKRLLVEHGQVDPQDIRVLVEKESTRANFKESVTQWLPSITQPGDTVFVFYHGHGGPIENRDGSESDGQDEILTTYDHDGYAVEGDYVASMHQTAVVDDALARWLQELPGRQIVLLVDSCYGGGLVDSARRGVSQFAQDEVQRVGDVTDLNVVVLSAGSAEEDTFSRVDDEENNSYLALSFRELAKKSQRPVTIREAFAAFKDYYRTQALAAIRYKQEPVLLHHALLDIYLFP